jgi:hypothetical protein
MQIKHNALGLKIGGQLPFGRHPRHGHQFGSAGRRGEQRHPIERFANLLGIFNLTAGRARLHQLNDALIRKGPEGRPWMAHRPVGQCTGAGPRKDRLHFEIGAG